MPSDPASVEHEILAPPPFDHNLTHFQKLSTCDVCNRARLCSKRVTSRRVVNEELDLAEPDAFGQQLACDHLIVFKSSRGKEHAALTVQDRFSKVLQAYPTISREASQIASNLKHFVGLKSNFYTYTIVHSDAAGEILRAVIEDNWLAESSVPSRFPHNSVLEREMRTFQEITRSLFLQAGFAARPQLWPQACSYVATAMSAFLKDIGNLPLEKSFSDPIICLVNWVLLDLKMQESSSSARTQNQPFLLDGNGTLEWSIEVFCHSFCIPTFVKMHRLILYLNFMTQRFACLKMWRFYWPVQLKLQWRNLMTLGWLSFMTLTQCLFLVWILKSSQKLVGFMWPMLECSKSVPQKDVSVVRMTLRPIIKNALHALKKPLVERM